MTLERKAEVNRRLAEFEGIRAVCFGLSITEAESMTRYCDDLNALARLEAKLPPHEWQIWCPIADGFTAMLTVGKWEQRASEGWFTEAEARAEAICQYLEALNAQSKTAKL